MAYFTENTATERRTYQNHVSKLRCRPRSDDLSEFLLIIFPLVYTVYFLGNVINVRGCFCIMQLLISFTNWLQHVVHLRFTSPCSVMVFALLYFRFKFRSGVRNIPPGQGSHCTRVNLKHTVAYVGGNSATGRRTLQNHVSRLRYRYDDL